MVNSVMFRCPDISKDLLLPKHDMDKAIKEFLVNKLEEDPQTISAIMIHTLNKSRPKVKACVDTLVSYLDNIIENTNKEMFWRIRQGNKLFQERVARLKGAHEFMHAAGFHLRPMPFKNVEEYFYVLDINLTKNINHLINMKRNLVRAKPIRAELVRDIKVYRSISVAPKFEIPDDFWELSVPEVKQEQNNLEEVSEELSTLRTKELRDRMQVKEIRKYKYTLIRVRMPDDIIVQGIFKTTEKLKHVYDFMRENLRNDWLPFHLSSSLGTKNDSRELSKEKSLATLGLKPTAILHFVWKPSMVKEISPEHKKAITKVYLKKHLMDAIQDMPVPDLPFEKETKLRGFLRKARPVWNAFLSILLKVLFCAGVAFIIIRNQLNIFDMNHCMALLLVLFIVNYTTLCMPFDRRGSFMKIYLSQRKNLCLASVVVYMVVKYGWVICDVYHLAILLLAVYIVNI